MKRGRSNLESKFALLWLAVQGPRLLAEVRFHEERKWRFDFAHVETRVAIEIEGGVWSGGRHVSGAGFCKDAEKYNEAAFCGWTVFRLTPDLIQMDTVQRLMKFIAEKEKLTHERPSKQ